MKAKTVIIILFNLFSAYSFSQSLQKTDKQGIFDIVFRQDFETSIPGEYSEIDWKKDWNNPTWANKDVGYGKIVRENGNIFLQEDFPPGTFLLTGSGVQWHAVFSKGYDELYLSYRVRFSDGFSNKDLHGKLPGLSGGKSNGGGYLPDGTDGWSARYMFHGTDINFYLYYPDLFRHFGDSLPIPKKKYYGAGPVLNPGFVLRPNVWYTVTQRVVLNTPGKSDGLIEGFINGKKCAQQTGIRFRDVSDLTIDRIYFANFLGGSGKKTSSREHICFDDFYVYTYKPDKKVPQKHELHMRQTTIQIPQNRNTK